MTEDRLLEVLEEALAARVIEELPRAVGRYQFTHALIQETLAEELSTTRKVRLHARIAQALEKLYSDSAEAHAAELAHHFAEAEAVLGAEKLVKYSLLAGEKALANYAWEEALAHFQRGLVAKGVPLEGTSPATDAEEAALLFGLGRAWAATGEMFQFQDAVSSLQRAFDYYVEAGDVGGAVAVAEYPIHPVIGRRIGVADLVARALALVPPESHEAGRLLPRYGLAQALELLDYAAAQETLARALAIAQREADAALEMRTLAYGSDVDCFHLRFQESVEKGLRAIEIAQRVDDLPALVTSRFYVARALDFIGDLEQSRLHTTAMLTAAEKLRDNSWLAWAYWMNGTLYRLEGNWQEAREFLDQGLAVAPRDPTLLCTRGVLEYEAGDFGQGEAHMNRLMEVMCQTAPGPIHEYA
jgi:tetratricopeptide (TPR) repeat protein